MRVRRSGEARDFLHEYLDGNLRSCRRRLSGSMNDILSRHYYAVYFYKVQNTVYNKRRDKFSGKLPD